MAPKTPKNIAPETLLNKKETKKIAKIRALITFHEARGGDRPGKVGDKRNHWSPNIEYDQVSLLKVQIEEIMLNSQKRSWGHEDAVKDMGKGVVKSVFKEREKQARKAALAEVAPISSPTSVAAPASLDDLPPALAI
mmetsp:Transcript_31552/g.63001  ORF Transcript_31552/g.63001 Transcript_31552/m.63001 type:complete len:137 (-) Transcript_31552:327-737(-)